MLLSSLNNSVILDHCNSRSVWSSCASHWRALVCTTCMVRCLPLYHVKCPCCFMMYLYCQMSVLKPAPPVFMVLLHTVPWARRTGAGFGLVGDRGQSLSMPRTCQCIHSKVDRLLSIVKEHSISIAPLLWEQFHSHTNEIIIDIGIFPPFLYYRVNAYM